MNNKKLLAMALMIMGSANAMDSQPQQSKRRDDDARNQAVNQATTLFRPSTNRNPDVTFGKGFTPRIGGSKQTLGHEDFDAYSPGPDLRKKNTQTESRSLLNKKEVDQSELKKKHEDQLYQDQLYRKIESKLGRSYQVLEKALNAEKASLETTVKKTKAQNTKLADAVENFKRELQKEKERADNAATEVGKANSELVVLKQQYGNSAQKMEDYHNLKETIVAMNPEAANFKEVFNTLRGNLVASVNKRNTTKNKMAHLTGELKNQKAFREDYFQDVSFGEGQKEELKNTINKIQDKFLDNNVFDTDDEGNEFEGVSQNSKLKVEDLSPLQLNDALTDMAEKLGKIEARSPNFNAEGAKVYYDFITDAESSSVSDDTARRLITLIRKHIDRILHGDINESSNVIDINGSIDNG
jgi:hypothetical protein